jgi:hypothetical protein
MPVANEVSLLFLKIDLDRSVRLCASAEPKARAEAKTAEIKGPYAIIPRILMIFMA